MCITSLIGNHVSFDYPPHFEFLPDYQSHRGQLVLVLRECNDTEADGPARGCEQMFKIRAADGWEGDAYATELSTPGAITPTLLGNDKLRMMDEEPVVYEAVMHSFPAVTQEEKDAILVGLRLLQGELSHDLAGDPFLLDIYSNGGRHTGLPAEGIELLCQRINL